MEYIINRTLGLCADFVSVFVMATDTPERLFGVKFPAEIERVRERLRPELLGVNDAFSLLVNPDMRLCYMSCVDLRLKLGDIQSLDGYIDMLFGCSDDEFAARCIFCFSNGTGKYKDYIAMVGDNNECVRYVNGMKISAESRALLLSVILDTAGYHEKARELARIEKRLVLDIHRENEKRIDEVFEQFNDSQAIIGFLRERNYLHENERFVIEPAYLDSLWLRCCTENDTAYCRVGWETISRASEYLDDSVKIPTVDEVGRLLSDKTRCDALRLLIERDYYQAEMAKALGIPTNTMFYHLQLMYDARLVTVRVEGRKSYYCLNREYFEAVKVMADRIISEIDGKDKHE